MTRRNDRQEPWVIGNQLAMNSGDNFLLTGMRAGSNPERATANLMTQLLELWEVDRQGCSRGFEVTDQGNFSDTQSAQAFRLNLVLREACRKRAEHGTDKASTPLPVCVGGRGNAAVEQRHRDSAGLRCQHEVGPQLRFDPQ